MEILVGGLVLVQLVTLYIAYYERKTFLNAVIAKTPQEFIRLEQAPNRKVRKPEPAQDDAGIPFGL